MMQQLAPAPVLRGLSEPLRMALERVPPHEQEVLVVGLEAAPEFMPLVTGASRDDSLRLEEGRFEGARLTGPDAQDYDFEHHARDCSGESAAPPQRAIRRGATEAYPPGFDSWTSLRKAVELDEEANLAQRFNLVCDLGLDDTRVLGGEYLFFSWLGKNPVAQPPFEDVDASPYARLGGVAALESLRHASFGEFSGALVDNQMRGK